MSATSRLAELGLLLPPPPAAMGKYVPWRIGGGLLFLSGVGPRGAGGPSFIGKVGAEIGVEAAREAARYCGLNLLANMQSALGSLDRVETILKVVGFVNAVPDFTQHPRVVDGCTDLFVDVFGEAGLSARSAPGMGSLPNNVAVICEAIVLIRD